MATARSVWVVAAVTAVVATVAGTAGFAVGSARTPDGLTPATRPSSFPVVLGSFADPRQVSVVPTPAPAASITAHRGGAVTSTSCRAGGTIESGTAPWSIDGAPVLALATAQPLYRDLGDGMRGADVAAFQQELTRLGYAVDAQGVYGSRTGRAVSALRQANGLAKGTALPLADVAWLPLAQPVMASCAALGSEVAPGGALGQARPALVGARVSPVPSDLVPGGRTLTFGGLTIAVAADGAIAEKDLPALDALPETAVALETLDQASPVPLTGILSLADPLTTATVPASAVVADGSLTCVSAGGSTTKVRVVSSQLGQSVISFDAATPPSTVDTQLDPSRACG